MNKPEPKPGWRIRLGNRKKGLVVNAATSERARELALAWVKDKLKDDLEATIISCQLMADDEIFVAEGDRWMPGGS